MSLFFLSILALIPIACIFLWGVIMKKGEENTRLVKIQITVAILAIIGTAFEMIATIYNLNGVFTFLNSIVGILFGILFGLSLSRVVSKW